MPVSVCVPVSAYLSMCLTLRLLANANLNDMCNNLLSKFYNPPVSLYDTSSLISSMSQYCLNNKEHRKYQPKKDKGESVLPVLLNMRHISVFK